MRRALGVLILYGIVAATAGCDAIVFPNPSFGATREKGEDGQPLVLDDLIDIATDPDLTDQGRREALEALGIRDEDLIDTFSTSP